MRKSRLIVLLSASVSVSLALAPGWGGKTGSAAGQESPTPAPSASAPNCPDFKGGGTPSPCTPGTPCINWPSRFELEGNVFISAQTPAAHSRDKILYDYTDAANPLMRVQYSRCPPLPLGMKLQHPEDARSACTFLFTGGKLYLTPAPPLQAGSRPKKGSCCLVFDKSTPFFPPNPTFPSKLQSWAIHLPSAPELKAPINGHVASLFPVASGAACGYYGVFEDLATTSHGQAWIWPASFSAQVPTEYVQIQFTKFRPAAEIAPAEFTLPKACLGDDVPYCVTPPNDATALGGVCASCHSHSVDNGKK